MRFKLFAVSAALLTIPLLLAGLSVLLFASGFETIKERSKVV